MIDGRMRYGDADYISQASASNTHASASNTHASASNTHASASNDWTPVQVDGAPKMLDGSVSRLLARASTAEPGLQMAHRTGRAA
jgi:hypothetical protein